MAVTAPLPEQRRFNAYGGAREMWYSRSEEILLSGPAGTGKSRAILEKFYGLANRYPGFRGLFLRKTRTSLTESALVTWEQKVVPAGHPCIGRIQRMNRTHYAFPNGSHIAVGGLDNPDRVMSTEYDAIYVQEATETEENDWEMAMTRLRAGAMPYQQIIGDCNPDRPLHWLYQRCQNGQTLLLDSRHEDNPTYWNPDTNEPTPAGVNYLGILDRLTGVRYQRLRLGKWVAAEGIIYEGWDPAVHRVFRFDIPAAWPRYWVVDFGYTNPFVWQAWAQDPDGRLFRYREIYRTQRLVEDHARDILAVTQGDPRPRVIVCDHDAEDRATLERHLKMGTIAAHKDVRPGLQAVATRLRVEGDGRSRLFYLRDSLVDKDAELVAKKRPTCTEEEYDGYVWDLEHKRKGEKGEDPLKENDHGMDATRYMVAHVDLKPRPFVYHGAGPARKAF